MRIAKLGKYRGIISAIALFVVINSAVLMLNFYMAAKFAKETELVNLAARQQTLSQQTVKSLLQTDNALGSGNVVDQPLAEFRQSYRIFDQTLAAFLDGGDVVATDGSPTYLAPMTDRQLRGDLEAVREIWLPFKDKIMPVVNFGGTIELNMDFIVGDDVAELEGEMFEAIVYSSEKNVSARLLEAINKVSVGLEKKADARAQQTQLIQIAGIVFALGAFFVIVFYFLRNLRRSDAALEEAEKEKDEILNTVNDGLFLLDRELNFGNQYSAAVERIFRRDDLAGESFLSLLRDIVPEKTLDTARDYIELFFGRRVNEKLVDDLNPLDQVEVHFKDGKGGFATRYLGFHFKRVLINDDLSHLLVTVDDITETIRLKRLLTQSQDQSKSQMDMLLDILHIEPPVLDEFMSGADDSLESINGVLKRTGQDQASYQGKLDDIFRRIHTLKGEAGALGLTSIADLAHGLEDLVVQLKDNSRLTGGDFLPLTMRLDELMSHLQSVRRLLQKLSHFRGAEQPPTEVEAKSEAGSDAQNLFTSLTDRISKEQGKKVQLVCNGFDMAALPGHFAKAVKDMSVQFIRNGVTHGIEQPAERLGAQKGQEGRVFVSFLRKQGHYELTYRDDGCGLSVDRIREAALAKGFIAADQIGQMNERQIMSLIFRRGFSTASKVDGNAGRGVGMDIIRQLVHELGGRVKMSTAEGKYTAFVVKLPLPDGGAVQAA